MNRAVVLDMEAANRILLGGAISDSWIGHFREIEDLPTLRCAEVEDVSYLLSKNAKNDSPLIVIAGRGDEFFPEIPSHHRVECFLRQLRVGLSKHHPQIKIPIDWRLFHIGSLLSFQTNRLATQLRHRACADFDPEGTPHVYLYKIETDQKAQLSKSGYDAELFEQAVLNLEEAIGRLASTMEEGRGPGHTTVTVTRTFDETDVSLGLSFRQWKEGKLTAEQLQFFNAPFDGPLRLRGAAGTGKTLALSVRFLKEMYDSLEQHGQVRCVFLTHGQETASNVRSYLTAMDEHGYLYAPPKHSEISVTTVHGLANEFINYDAERIQPLSLDGAEGRRLQFELIAAVLEHQDKSVINNARQPFRSAACSLADTDEHKAFCCDVMDEFSSVLEAFPVREVDEIADRYMKASPTPRSIAQTDEEKQFIFGLYRSFRDELASMDVVSLDQFIADFLGYLNSFRWNQVRQRKGFDFVFADELHLFNRQERQVLGYLARDPRLARRVAVAYDPRQSPRNSFFPEARSGRDSIWREANLSDGAQQFQLNDVFRYTPQILHFLREVNQHFPADDMAEEWGLTFGTSKVEAGEHPTARLFPGISSLGPRVAERAKELDRKLKRGQRVAVLCLDPDRFATYSKAGVFQDNFVVVSARDEVDSIKRYSGRAVLSMPEFVAGLQFEAVILVDANAGLVGRLGIGAAGLQRFISALYLGASRAKRTLEIVADASDGGFAGPIRQSISGGTVVEVKSK